MKRGVYWFVVSETTVEEETEADEEFFAFNLFAADIEGTLLNSTQQTWTTPSPTVSNTTAIIPAVTVSSNVTCTVAEDASESLFFASTFTLSPGQQQAGTELTDILVYLQTDTKILDQPVVAIYEGDVLSVLFGNDTVNTTAGLNPCTALTDFNLVAVVKGNLNDLTTRYNRSIECSIPSYHIE